MHPETSMSPWIPALLAGMTESTAFALTEQNAWSDIFHEAHEDPE
jgi:hypothetical protein